MQSMNDGTPRIAVLMTCHNRRALTTACLISLKEQETKAILTLFLVDDGSTDDTASDVRKIWPDACIISGSGDLWWNGGMRLAWSTAKKHAEFDFFLWLNDDVVLQRNAIRTLLTDLESVKIRLSGLHLVAGATVDPITKVVNYGGHMAYHNRRPLRLTLLGPNGQPQECMTISGNCVLVPKEVEFAVGNLDGRFKHIYGDLDYGFKVRSAGGRVWLASQVVGTCGTNSNKGTSLDQKLTKIARIRLRLKEDRKVHAKDWRAFVKLHGRAEPFSFLYSVSPYVRIIIE